MNTLNTIVMVLNSWGEAFWAHASAMLVQSGIKRRDLTVNLLQTLLQVFYFYNPFLWVANARIRLVREEAVDETVMVSLGDDGSVYSNALVDIVQAAFHRPPASLHLVGVVESKRALARRILHMARMPIPRSAAVGVLGLSSVFCMAAVLLPMARASQQPAAPDSTQQALSVFATTR